MRGPVSRLISVESQYATAVEIALGAAMQNIVVETEADAKRAIARLKEQRAGRGTFLPMTSIKGRALEEKGLEDCVGFVGMAVDLISFDAQYREIMASLLGRVAVAEDLDAAASIARRYGWSLSRGHPRRTGGQRRRLADRRFAVQKRWHSGSHGGDRS